MTPKGLLMPLVAVSGGLAICMFMAPKQQAPMPDDFVNQVRAGAPAAIRECVVKGLREKWPSKAAVYREANAARAVRGKTDVVNFAVGKLTPACEGAGETPAPAAQ